MSRQDLEAPPAYENEVYENAMKIKELERKLSILDKIVFLWVICLTFHIFLISIFYATFKH